MYERVFSYVYLTFLLLQAHERRKFVCKHTNFLHLNSFFSRKQAKSGESCVFVSGDLYGGWLFIMLRTYTYDILGRPTARNTARHGSVVNDTFAHNTRSELVEAHKSEHKISGT